MIGLTRNAGRRGYRQAHRLATERRSAARPRKMTPELWREVEEKLALQWSPDLGAPAPEGRVSHEWSYKYGPRQLRNATQAVGDLCRRRKCGLSDFGSVRR